MYSKCNTVHYIQLSPDSMLINSAWEWPFPREYIVMLAWLCCFIDVKLSVGQCGYNVQLRAQSHFDKFDDNDSNDIILSGYVHFICCCGFVITGIEATIMTTVVTATKWVPKCMLESLILNENWPEISRQRLYKLMLVKKNTVVVLVKIATTTCFWNC